MQNIKKTLKSKRFWLGTVLPFALAVAAAFVARYQLEISDGVTANYMAGQWPVYAPLNALTAFCLTLVVFALCGSWGIATGVSGRIFTVLALVNYYTRDLHGSALMPQDILNPGTAAEVMGSYTLHITQTVITIALLYIPVLVAAVVQVSGGKSISAAGNSAAPMRWPAPAAFLRCCIWVIQLIYQARHHLRLWQGA